MSVLAGIAFFCIRLFDAIYQFRKGNVSLGVQELLVKAVLELISGFLGIVPVWGAALSLTLDAILACWDVGNVLLSSSSSAQGNTCSYCSRAVKD